MIDDQRVELWTKDAVKALARHLGNNNEIALLASMIIALAEDRREREDFITREGRRWTPSK